MRTVASSQLSCAGDRLISEPVLSYFGLKNLGFSLKLLFTQKFHSFSLIIKSQKLFFLKMKGFESSVKSFCCYFFLPRWNILVNSTSPYFSQMFFYRTGFFPLTVFRFTIFWNWVSTSICAAHIRKMRTDQWCATVPGDGGDQGSAGICWKAELDTSPHN